MRASINEYKHKTMGLLHIIIWIIIIILSINFIFKSIAVLGPQGGRAEQVKKTENIWVSKLFNSMINSNLPILKYAAGNEKEHHFVYDNFSSMFPINQYAVEHVDISREYLIEKPCDTLYFTKSIKNRLNAKYYYSMIILEMQNKINRNVDYMIEYMERPSTILTGGGVGRLALASNTLTGIIPIDIISGEVYMEYDHHSNSYDNKDIKEVLGVVNGEYFTLEQLLNRQFLYNNFYILDQATTIDNKLFDAEYFWDKDFTMKKKSDKPQILVYHTHSQEAFVDSREGVLEDTIVGVGAYLTELLENKYGFQVIHDTSRYDMMEGYLERNLAYNHAGVGVANILKENPSIEVVIDVHRDGNDRGMKRMSKIGGKDTAQIMLFNGLSRNTKGKIEYLNNPYLKDNLAFSLQLQLKGRESYPGLMFKNYLHAYRYNLHFREKSILAEVGTNWNTVEEAMNSMEYLASLLNDVLTGD